MRTGIDGRLVGYRRGGIATYVAGLAEGLAECCRDEKFTLFRSRKGPSQAPGVNFQVHTLRTPPHHRLEQWTLPVELAFEGLDVLHCPDFIPPFRRRCPAVITVHDLAFLRYPETKDDEALRYYGQIEKAVASAEGIIAVTEATRRDLAQLLGVAEGRVDVVRHGIARCFRPLNDEDALNEFRLRHGLPARFMLWVGTIEPRKNLPVLFRAMGLFPGETLVVAGQPGWKHQATWEMLTDLEREGRAVYYGPAGEEDLVMLYNCAWAFVFPSIYEGFGLPPLEAIACGTPVVSASIPALREVLGGAAVWVEPHDPESVAAGLLRLRDDESERMRLRVEGLERARGFRWDRAAAETMVVYRKAAGR